MLGTYAGDAHPQTAEAMRQRMIQTAPEIGAARVHSTTKGSMIIFGRYEAVDDPAAQTALKDIKSIQVNRTRPFGFAMLSRIVPEVPTASLDPIDLRTVRRRYPNMDELFTLQIAVWVTADNEFSVEQARAESEAFARRLRAEQHEAYFYHDPVKGTSHVSIGVFDETAYDPKSTLFSPQVERLLRRFPHLLVNGEEALVQVDPNSRVRHANAAHEHAGERARMTVATSCPVLGQPRAIGLLATAMQRGCLPHALILHGPFGVGKFTTAMTCAQLILDPEATEEHLTAFAPPTDTRTAALIGRGAHPDLHVIRKELVAYSSNAAVRTRKQRNIPIDLLRERMIGGRTGDDAWHDAVVSKTPLHGHGKVFIIDEAELLESAGQNSLLKTLEEPPPGTHIFLVTTNEDRLLPTIRSRCQRIAFGPLDADAMAHWLDASGLEFDGPQREWIEAFAAGSPGTAVIATENRFFDWHRSLAPMIRDLESGQYPAELADTMATLVNDYAEAKVKASANASKEAANHDGARQLFALPARTRAER